MPKWVGVGRDGAPFYYALEHGRRVRCRATRESCLHCGRLFWKDPEGAVVHCARCIGLSVATGQALKTPWGCSSVDATGRLYPAKTNDDTKGEG